MLPTYCVCRRKQSNRLGIRKARWKVGNNQEGELLPSGRKKPMPNRHLLVSSLPLQEDQTERYDDKVKPGMLVDKGQCNAMSLYNGIWDGL
jgi:hypothetical protein